MKKPKNKKITVMIDEDFQSQMQKVSEEFDVEWSEKIRNFIANEIKFIKQNNDENYKAFLERKLCNRQ